MESRTGYLITRISQVQARVFQRLLQNAGIEEFNGAQGRILYVLWQEDGVPITELSRKTGLAKNTLTAMLSRMEDAGLLSRLPDPQDRRQSRIRLTDRARGLEAAFYGVSEEMTRLFYADLPQEDAAVLDAYLDRILANLEETENDLKKERS